jgi:hypothetical protein
MAALRVIEGERQKPIDGKDVIAELVGLLDARLPSLSPHDPVEPHLRDLRLCLSLQCSPVRSVRSES